MRATAQRIVKFKSAHKAKKLKGEVYGAEEVDGIWDHLSTEEGTYVRVNKN